MLYLLLKKVTFLSFLLLTQSYLYITFFYPFLKTIGSIKSSTTSWYPYKPTLAPPAAFLDFCKNRPISEISKYKIDCYKVYRFKPSGLHEEINSSVHVKDLKSGEIFRTKRIKADC